MRLSRSDFDAIYTNWFGGVSKWALEMGVRSADRHDVAQNVFIIVQRRLRDFDGRNLPGWLYAITARLVRDYRRQRWNTTYFRNPVEICDQILCAGPMRASLPAAHERNEFLDRMLGKLRPTMRTAVVLFHLHGLSCEEIASMQGVSSNTIWARLRRARKKIAALAHKSELLRM